MSRYLFIVMDKLGYPSDILEMPSGNKVYLYSKEYERSRS